MRHVPSEKDLDAKVKLVEIEVFGEYIARIDDKRRTSKRYEVKVLVPETFTLSDIKRLTPKTLMTHPAYGDFLTMRTFEKTDKNPRKTDETIKRRDLYNLRELERFKKIRKEVLKAQKEEQGARGVRRDSGVMVGDTSEYGDDGLPPVING